jgi:ABC-type glycerol-3-phosphate transport system substrate-binding protein
MLDRISRSKGMGRVATLAAMLLAAVLAVAGCGGSGSGGEEAADFSATTLEGEEFELQEKRGEVVALYFMAAY